MILDTNFLIDIDNNIPSALGKARELEKKGRPRRVPRVVVYRVHAVDAVTLHVGLARPQARHRRRFTRPRLKRLRDASARDSSTHSSLPERFTH
jgi:23S rRNA C2498 (ribose-2'-O)-methylase RlmM